MNLDDHRFFSNVACRVKGTCSFVAIWHGFWANTGLDRLRILKSRVGEVWRRFKGGFRLWLYERRERKLVKEFAAGHPGLKVGDVIKPIALYLPQFHTFPENDAWWGKGFTEWTNVKKAKPLFKGHYQPHVPHPDVGYYDLSDVEVMRRQAAMAKKYGVSGFCFYYYHFANGKRLLEKPLNNWLAAKDIDFPFCYCWANENWTRAWDGGDKEVIMPQDYGRDNMRAMFRDMLVAFKDSRYIKVGAENNTPLLLVYRAEIVPDIVEVTEEWRRMAREAGFDGLYLISVQGFKALNPFTIGLDAACEFATPYQCSAGITHKVDVASGGPVCKSYDSLLHRVRSLRSQEYVRYKCIAPSWDNTPRKAERGTLFTDVTTKKFTRLVTKASMSILADCRLRENGFLFVNAWNEWGEGAHLEPDLRYGYGWLEAIAKVMDKTMEHL